MDRVEQQLVAALPSQKRKVRCGRISIRLSLFAADVSRALQKQVQSNVPVFLVAITGKDGLHTILVDKGSRLEDNKPFGKVEEKMGFL